MTPLVPAPDGDGLVHRFLDDELSAEERLELVTRLGQDATFRRRTLHLGQVLLQARDLPRPLVPDAFVADVLNRTAPDSAKQTAREAGPKQTLRRLVAPLLAPRVLQWNALQAAGAAACVVVLAVAMWPATRPAGTTGREGTPQRATSPVLVRLVMLQPGARSVQAAGDFNGWDPASTPLEPTTSGAWTVTLRLEPGRYEYMFVVDGERWVADPFAIEQTDDGFGARNAVLDVRPAEGEL
jgi:Glycogen recognition site of AMP-activated protein kinase